MKRVAQSSLNRGKNPLPTGVWLIAPALFLFLIGILAPSVVINEFGNLRRLSLIAGIHVLWQTGHGLLAVLIFLFTILFPPAKLVVTAVVGLPQLGLSDPLKRRLHAIVEHLGKWSLLDVLVISILIVAIKVQGFVSVEAAWGLYVFTAAIFLSMLATYFVKYATPDLPGLFQEVNPITTLDLTQHGRNRHSKVLAILGLVLLISGPGWFVLAPVGNVMSVHVIRRDTLIELPRLFGNPSYFVQIRTAEGPQRLDTKHGTPIGNGLLWPLKKSVPLTKIYEVELFDHGHILDKLIDRVTIKGRNAIGQRFEFTLQGRVDWQRPVAVLVTIAGIITLSTVSLSRFNRNKQSNALQYAELQQTTNARSVSGEVEPDPSSAKENAVQTSEPHDK